MKNLTKSQIAMLVLFAIAFLAVAYVVIAIALFIIKGTLALLTSPVTLGFLCGIALTVAFIKFTKD